MVHIPYKQNFRTVLWWMLSPLFSDAMGHLFSPDLPCRFFKDGFVASHPSVDVFPLRSSVIKWKKNNADLLNGISNEESNGNIMGSNHILDNYTCTY